MSDEEKRQTQFEVNKKNTAAVSQTLEDFRAMHFEQQQRIDGLMSMIATLDKRMLELENLVRVQKAMMHGTGPSVR
jgi:hypothetical protein